jgi:phage minor structural protein
MYQVSILNNGIETLIHYPTAAKDAPHILTLNMKEGLSLPEALSFVMNFDNPGYTSITGLKTKVKVYDTRDNSVVFSGRVAPTKDGMSGEGKFTNEVLCEGALAYLVDTHTRRWNFKNKTPQYILQYILDQHNAKVDTDRKIYLGTVELSQTLTIDTNYETSLNAIITKVRNILGGDIRVQERDGLLYLDYLRALGTNNEVLIRLGYNLKEIIREYDPTDVVTAVIPLGYGEGVNQLDIKKVNNGSEVLEDAVAVAQYGYIEGQATNKDIQSRETLKTWGQTVLNEKKQPRLTYEQTALDLSVLSGHENEKYELGDTLHTIVDVMDIDVYARVIERERDLLNSPWDPKLTISTRPIRLTDQIIDLKQRNLSLENAPQGSTCIFPLIKAENADAEHPIEFDLDIPKESVNINRVYINLHGRKYRVDSKDSAAGGSYTRAQEAATSDFPTEKTDQAVYSSEDIPISSMPGRHYHYSTQYILDHKHSINIPAINISPHTHAQVLGIVEGTYPKNVKIKVNGTDIGVNFGSGSSFDEYDIDITDKVTIGNNKIIISTEQNGRIDAVIYAQIFIQAN